MSNGIVASVTRAGRYEPWELQVARGEIYGHSLVNIFGYGTTPASSGVYYPAWELATSSKYYVFPTTAAQMYLASTVSGDNGITIQITGLDGNYNPISEVLALGGTSGTGVITTNSYFRINNIQVALTSSANPTGVISLQNQAATSGATIYAQINTVTLNGNTTSIGTSQMSVYTVPAGYGAYFGRFTVNDSFTGNTTNYITYRAVAQYPSALTTSATLISRIVLQSPVSGAEFNIQRQYPFYYPSGTDLVWQVAPSSATAVSVGINIGGVLIQNNNTSTVPGG